MFSRFWYGAGAGILATLIALASIAYIAVVSGIISPGADEAIPPIERWAANTSLRAYLEKNQSKLINKFAANDENLNAGIDLYVKNCAACHGLADGKRTVIGNGMYKQPNYFGKEDWSKEQDGLIYWYINHGVRLTAMPSFKKSLTEDEQWKLVLFIKHMPELPAKPAKYWQSFVKQ